MKPVTLLGAGGHCKAAIDVIESSDEFTVAGIVTEEGGASDSVLGYPVLGNDSDLPRLLVDGALVLVAVGQIKTALPRRKLFEKIRDLGGTLPVIVSAHAYVSPHATIDEGSLVMHGAVINAKAAIGCNSIINSMALLEHDVQIGNHSHVSTGARINGDVKIEDECFIGSGAVLRDGVSIGRGSVIGAGSIIVKSVAPGSYIVNK